MLDRTEGALLLFDWHPAVGVDHTVCSVSPDAAARTDQDRHENNPSAAMSGALTAAALNPQPERWGAFRAGNIDSRARDTTPDLAPISDTISTAVCTVTRRDGLPMSGQDLTWTGVLALDTALRVVSVVLTAGTNVPGLTVVDPVDYLVTITAQTNGGRRLSWDTYQLVVAEIG
jgi:hypothetical protein